MLTNIYILKLQDNNYYVGKAKDVNKRFQQHISGNGSSWTKKYKPIEIVKVINNCSPFEEDKQVKELMSLYGIDKVRGGSYSKIELTSEEKEILQKEIWGAKDLCNRCGNSNHFIKDCYATKDINGHKIEDKEIVVWICEHCDKEYENVKEGEKHEKICKQKVSKIKDKEIVVWSCDNCNKVFEDCNKCIIHEKICRTKLNKIKVSKKCCKRCGRQNHNENNCYASTHVDGYDLDDITDSDDECSLVLDIVENTIKQMNVCFRCGREGHYANNCYASKHIKGYYIN